MFPFIQWSFERSTSKCLLIVYHLFQAVEPSASYFNLLLKWPVWCFEKNLLQDAIWQLEPEWPALHSLPGLLQHAAAQRWCFHAALSTPDRTLPCSRRPPFPGSVGCWPVRREAGSRLRSPGRHHQAVERQPTRPLRTLDAWSGQPSLLNRMATSSGTDLLWG